MFRVQNCPISISTSATKKRDQVFEYLAREYGSDHVARLGTVSMYRAKAALNESGAALKIPRWRMEQFTNNMIENPVGEREHEVEQSLQETETGRKLLNDFPEISIATRIEGHPRHYSQHAGGVIITDAPVIKYVGIDARTNATQCDKADAEKLNLLKVDCLGLRQMSIFDDCLNMIGKQREWLFDYPIDDEAAFEILNKQKWSGVFQWNGAALQNVTTKINVTEFEDLVVINSLARPGPAAQVDEWVRRKNGDEPLSVKHEALFPILQDTFGVLLYQEQVMRVARDIGDMEWVDVNGLRRAMSKSKGRAYINEQYRDKFIPGATKKVGHNLAEVIWEELIQFGGYGFNKSHAVAYALVAYWCCVLKAHFPVEFAAATLSHEPNPEKQLRILREMAAEGVEYIPVDPERSTAKWEVHEGKLLGPLTTVKGLGAKLLHEILYARKQNMPLPKRALKLLSQPHTSIDSLFALRDRVQVLIPDPLEFGIVSTITPIDKIQLNGSAQEVVCIGKLQEINVRTGKRGNEYLHVVIEDDTDRITGRVAPWEFDRKYCQEIREKGMPGKAIWLIKGTVNTDFRSIQIKKAKFVGLTDD